MGSNQDPLVSVLVPAYNAERYLDAALQSVLDQTYQNWELIVVDDASSDRTGEIIGRIAKKDSRVRQYRNSKNLNIAPTRNKLIKLARGKYIAWQDADDISLPKRLEHQVRYMEGHPRVGICGGFLQFFSEDGEQGIRKYAEDDKDIRKTVFRYATVAQPAAVIRKECFDEVGMFDETIPQSQAEDLDMALRIGSKYEFANLQEVVIRYRVHASSATFSKLRQMELNTIMLRRKYSSGFGYTMTASDKLYNLLQYVSIFVIPPRMKIWLFNLLRNSK